MTRETKLGLLIGTGIILLIAIVVSDQLSVVKNDGAPTAEYGMDSGLAGSVNLPQHQTPPLTGLDLAPTPGLQTPNPYPALPGATINIGDPGTNNMVPADHSPTPYPAPYRNPSPVPPVPLPQANPLPGATVMQPFGNPPSAMSVQEQPISVGTHGQVTPSPSLAQGEQAIGLFDPLPPQPTVSQYEPQPTGRGLDLGSSTNTLETSIQSKPKTITVRSGDTLEALARKHMGAGKHWQALFNANKDKLKKPQDLRPGMELTVPAIEIATTPQPRTFTDLDTTTVTSRTDTRSTTYTVKKGDTLYGIAQRELGNSTRWQDILNANKQQLKGKATNLKPGMKLNMPSQQAPVSNNNSASTRTPYNGMAVESSGSIMPPASLDSVLLLDQPLDPNPTPIAKPIG